MSVSESAPVLNHVLKALSEADRKALDPHLDVVDLALRMSIERRLQKVEHVYFPDNGIVSVVANGKHAVEVGVIGRDGMTGVSVVLGAKLPPSNDTYVQIAGDGRRVSSAKLQELMTKSASMRQTFLLYAHSFLIQVSQTALANARGSLDQRLARWLLMVNDRIDGNVVSLTHEFLGVMLSVRRAGVTLALRELERTGTISQRRGSIIIVDRKALEDIASDTYFPPT